MLIRKIAAAIMLSGLLGCAMPVQTPNQAPRPDVAQATSMQSALLRSTLAIIERKQLAQGLLRTDGGGPDTPFTANMLARNFEAIAFFNEYDGAVWGRGGPSPLRKWKTPIRIGVLHGPSVPPAQRARDIEMVTDYSARLSRLTGHPIEIGGRVNFWVIFADQDHRAEILANAAAKLPDITVDSLTALRDLRPGAYCAVAAFATGDDAHTYTSAVALIPSENPALLRQSCVHEEIAQALGLANDSPEARPSIFNDDDEFALLTSHDELLLKMLYDPRLRPGLLGPQARSIVHEIAQELVQ